MKSFLLSLVLQVGAVIVFPLVTVAGDRTTDNLIRQADYLQHRHEILAQNVANVSTPHYTTKDLEKPESLTPNNHKLKIQKVRMVTTNPRHIRANKNKSDGYHTILDRTSPVKANKNNVDLTKQVTNIAQNGDEMSTALKNYRTAMDLINTASGNGGP